MDKLTLIIYFNKKEKILKTSLFDYKNLVEWFQFLKLIIFCLYFRINHSYSYYDFWIKNSNFAIPNSKLNFGLEGFKTPIVGDMGIINWNLFTLCCLSALMAGFSSLFESGP